LQMSHILLLFGQKRAMQRDPGFTPLQAHRLPFLHQPGSFSTGQAGDQAARQGGFGRGQALTSAMKEA